MKRIIITTTIVAVLAAIIVILVASGATAAEPATPSDNGVGREPVFNLTEEGQKMLARLVWLESRGCSYDCRRAITEVVLNRLASGIWGDTITDVMFAPGQFPPVNYLYTVPEDDVGYVDILDIVRDVCENGCRIPSRVVFYVENGYFPWAIAEFEIDGAYFSSSVYYQPEGVNA